jgi:hypothetical protein
MLIMEVITVFMRTIQNTLTHPVGKMQSAFNVEEVIDIVHHCALKG